MASKVLLVDNNPNILVMLKRVFEQQNSDYIIFEAASDFEALKIILTETLNFAVIDVRLGTEDEQDKSGLSLALAISQISPDTRVIMLSRFIDLPQIVQALRYYGVVDFIEKYDEENTYWSTQVYNAIEKVRKSPSIRKLENSTLISFLLTPNQPIAVRTHGMYVNSALSTKNLPMNMLNDMSEWADLLKNEDAGKTLRLQANQIGRNLERVLFVENREIDLLYSAALDKSQGIHVIFEGARDLLKVPLEFLRRDYHPDPMCLKHPVVRLVQNALPRRKPISIDSLALMTMRKRLRILIIASNTEPSIPGVDIETASLKEFIDKQNDYLIEADLIPTSKATYKYVREQLRQNDYDIIHYAGHGSFAEGNSEESSLFFWTEENQSGDVVPLKAHELKIILEQSSAKLIYLSACESASTDSNVQLLYDDFLGLADVAIQAGIPEVIGYRWPVSDSGALQISLAFYRFLLQDGNPMTALWKARNEYAGINRGDLAWLSPIHIRQE